MYLIAIIDDSFEDREVYKRFLKKDSACQYKFIEADSGEAGVELCKSHTPDCVLLDYRLSDVNAKVVLDKLKEELEALPPVIVTTGQGSEAIAVEVMQEGVQDYLVKSVLTPKALQRAVKNTIDRARLHKAVLFKEKELKTVLNTVVDGVLVTDEKGEIQSSNPAISRIFGYSQSELSGENVKLMVPESYMSTDGATAMSVGREVKGKHKDGSVFPLELSVNEMVIGDKVKFVGTLRDISERKEKERQIRHEKERADEANKAKSLFLATMSHEIRTPMNGIIGAAELLTYCGLDEKARHYVETIQSSGELLLVLINDILDFSKIEAGELEFESVPVVLNTLLSELIHMLSDRANDNEVELALRYPQDIPESIYTDPIRLRQILINFLSNAIKFSRGGHILISIDNVKQTDDTVTLRFEIQDTGIGIAKDKIESIFEQFSQADSSTTREYGGTGLGLAICKKLVTLMGGEIGVDSTLGKGSTFWFENSFNLHSHSQVMQIKSAQKLTNKRILIVDDYAINLTVFSDYLKENGIACETASSAHDALEKIAKAQQAQNPYDVVLIDYHMPKMNGEMMGRAIKGASERYGQPKLILFTAMGKKDSFDDIEYAGFSDYLIKPIYPHTFIDTIAKVLDMEELETVPESQLDTNDGGNRSTITAYDATILIAEDVKMNQKVARAMVESFGCSCDIVEDGEAAVRVIEAEPEKYDIILMDCQMPRMDGFDATKALRSKKLSTQPIIIAMTANAMPGDKEKCIESGMDDYISKPVKMVDFKKILEKYTPELKL